MADYQKEYGRLNAAQRHAVDTIEGPVLVVAGPGTGKTQLISMRVASILKQTDANPANILCLTFTEAAAHNMRERLSGMIGEAAYHVGIYTFHSFGSDIIQRFPEYFYEDPVLKPVDELGAYELLRSIFDTLPHSNPLSLRIGEDYLHLRSVQSAISWFKQAGLEPKSLRNTLKANHAFITFANPLIEKTFVDSPSPAHLSAYRQLARQLADYAQDHPDNTLARLAAAELTSAVDSIGEGARYVKPVTTWRNTWLKQDTFKHWVLADRRRNRLTEAVVGVYEKFQKALQAKGLYTFDDMILRTVRALERETELRLSLQEQYQYILVDEYQDTNGAQNRLLELLADNPVNEGRPNLLVVGDDDQAIYRFQGAQASIMLDFINRWRDVEEIVLTDNYRSHQRVLDLARYVITQGEERLETSLPQLNKQLRAALPAYRSPSIIRPQAVSELDQYQYIAQEIRDLLHKGEKPDSIAVLAPKHAYLQALVPYLMREGIPIKYERREHILEQPRIAEIIDLAGLVMAASAGRWDEVDAKLPQVLSAEYWELQPSQLWQVSLQAFREHRTWLEVLQAQKSPVLKHIPDVILSLARTAQHLPVELTLDQLIGNAPVLLENGTTWTSPYRNYYFSETRLEANPTEYLKLIGQLTILREHLRDYRPGERLNLKELLDFIGLYRQSGLNLLDTNPHQSQEQAVELLTAYKAKGLEWETVFMLGCHNDIWGPKARSSNYSFALPSNLAWIRPARDSADDRLRLFYVALTRAKSRLYLTCFKQTGNGRTTEPVSWLAGEGEVIPPITPLPARTTEELVEAHEINWASQTIVNASLKEALRPFLDTYQLSATHLNDFLDLTRGGPRRFLLRHILHFPESQRPSSVFGSAMHQTLHFIHTSVNTGGKLPSQTQAAEHFQAQLQDSAILTDQDLEQLLERGKRALNAFMKSEAGSFLKKDRSEYDFKAEGVRMGDIRLTGKVDVIRQSTPDMATVIDYKTGTPMAGWRPSGAYPQIRAHLYQLQLILYKHLVEGSAHLGNLQVTDSRIQFVEPDEDGNFLTLDYEITQKEEARFASLLTAIWQHIMDLNFPDTSRYSLDLKGVRAFEDDLINGKI